MNRTAELSTCTDEELVDIARGNDPASDAVGELYRRHERTARNIATHILHSRTDAEDVVSDAFAGLIAAIGNGAGPRSNFRHYLMACVRNGCRSKGTADTISTDPSQIERFGPTFEDPERFCEAGLVAGAFSSLSSGWQQMLWLTAVEQRSTSEIGDLLGRSPAAVAALAYRAREAFAAAYLVQHKTTSTSEECERLSPKLGQFIRGHAADMDRVRIERHLEGCTDCNRAVDELSDINSSLRSLTGPGPLLLAATATAGATAAELTAVGVGGWSFGVGASVLLKVAALGVLLVPATLVAASVSSPETVNNVLTEIPVAPASRPGLLGRQPMVPPSEVAIAPTSVAPTFFVAPSFVASIAEPAPVLGPVPVAMPSNPVHNAVLPAMAPVPVAPVAVPPAPEIAQTVATIESPAISVPALIALPSIQIGLSSG